MTDKTVSRRDFLKISGVVGGAAAFLGSMPQVGKAVAAANRKAQTYPLNNPENVIYSKCLNCHNACPIKGHILDGVLVKIDGNPYSPQNLNPHMPESTPLADAARIDAPLCPKGQGGVQVLYDPYRIRKVLKRAGKRGENKWVTIEWDQFIDEIVNGGDLFGEGNVDGFDAVWKLRDPALSKELSTDAAAVASGKMTLAEFKSKHKAHLDVLIDPDHPDLGPVNNQFIFQGGRVEHGRKEFTKRFTYNSFGSVNYYLHTTICEQSHHIAYAMATTKTHMKPDTANSEFIIYFGTSPFEANFGPTNMTPKITQGVVDRGLKYAVVDPRLSKTAGKAWKWVSPKPGSDAAIALGMIRWIIENERYDAAFLSAPNKDAANAIGETSFSDATHLVRTDQMKYLKPEDAGLEVPLDDKGNPISSHVVLTDGVPALSAQAEKGDLLVNTKVNGIPVKSAFQLLADRAAEKTLDEYAEYAGISVRDIVELADEFTSHGKKAAVELYRGPVQHTNGYYNGLAIITLNALIGNLDWKGGLTTGGSHWHEDGSKAGQPFPKGDLVSAPGGFTAFGIHINRESAAYEKSTLFEGYPAKRPWYPFTNELYQNVIPSAAAGYPYPGKILLIQKGTPILASPAGQAQIEILRDPTKIPLVLACDVVIGETSMYADYIIPDLTYMERWGHEHTSPDVVTQQSKVRQPMVSPLTEIVTVDGEDMPISIEALLISIGKKLGLPGFGKNGLGEGHDFNRPEDYYLAMAANLAFGDAEDGSQTLPPATEEEMAVFRAARAHLSKAVFDEEKWKKAVPEALWPSVVTLLNKGGRFEAAEKAYKGDKLAHQFKGQWSLFVEKVAQGKNSISGENFDGLPKVEPVADASGAPVQQEGDLHLITYKEVTGGQSRTHGAYWLQTMMPENHVLLNSVDARRLGLKSGDTVKLTSSSLPGGKFDLGDGRTYEVKGTVKVIEGLRPGTVAVSWSYGHWAYGSNDVIVNGAVVKGDASRRRGTVVNPLMMVDPVVGDVCLTDPIGGSASFYDSFVSIQKI
ncbi:MAG: molybdopterin-dependent oxidoreductase [Anaerolineales bacterium]